MNDSATTGWQRMAAAPRDGSPILVTLRSTEQGSSEVDVVSWARPNGDDEPCWMSTDSSAGCPIVYEHWELRFWMPLPDGMAPVRSPGFATRVPVAPKSDELDGSGI